MAQSTKKKRSQATAERSAAIISPLLTVDEAAAYLRRPRRWVYYVLRYEIPIVKSGNRIFFEQRDLDVWIATHKEVPR